MLAARICNRAAQSCIGAEKTSASPAHRCILPAELSRLEVQPSLRAAHAKGSAAQRCIRAAQQCIRAAQRCIRGEQLRIRGEQLCIRAAQLAFEEHALDLGGTVDALRGRRITRGGTTLTVLGTAFIARGARLAPLGPAHTGLGGRCLVGGTARTSRGTAFSIGGRAHHFGGRGGRSGDPRTRNRWREDRDAEPQLLRENSDSSPSVCVNVESAFRRRGSLYLMSHLTQQRNLIY